MIEYFGCFFVRRFAVADEAECTKRFLAHVNYLARELYHRGQTYFRAAN